MAEQPFPFVTCEKLIAINANAGSLNIRSDWWRALLEGAPLFDGDGLRFQACDREAVAEQTQAALAAGYHPIVLFPDRVNWTAVVDGLGLKRYQVGLLFRGEDDAAIRYLLRHPSLEVLQARAGRCKLAYPSRRYKEALERWLAQDGFAQEAIRKLRENEVWLEDFERANGENAEAEEEPEEGAALSFELVWTLDRHYRVRLTDEGEPGRIVRLRQSHEEDPGRLAEGIAFGGEMLWFKDDICELRDRPALARAIAEWFRLPGFEPAAGAVAPSRRREAARWQRWQVPSSLAAGVLIGFLTAYGLPYLRPGVPPEPDDGKRPVVSRGGNGDTAIKGRPPLTGITKLPEDLDKLTEQEWLELIADLVYEGEIAQAEALLGELKRRFPKYVEGE